jgi:DNA-binding CsgD family transcriptional regulator
MELLDEAIAGLDASEHDLILRLEAAWLSVAWDRGLLDDVLTRGKQFAGLEGRTPGECLVLAYLAHARMDSGLPVAEVAPLAERAARREFALELGLHSAWLIHTGTVLRTAERLETELNLLDHAVTEAQSRGSLRGYVLASMYRAAVLIRAGDVTGSEADARAALAADARDLVFLPAVAQLVEALVEQGRLDEAAVLLGSHDLAGELGDFRHGTVLLFSRALLRAEQGAHAAALADLAEARERLDRVGRLNVVGLDGRVRGALLLRALKRLEEADAEAVLAVEAATRWGTSGAIGTAEHGLALVRGDLELLEHAVEQLAGSPLRLAYAKALVDLGAMLRRTGRRSDSRAPLRAALALADECGATATRERARQELAAGGVRVRREAVRGVAALTPSERRIAERAAAGASNPEIAQALFVTVKTVEMHLSHAYRKLGIPGRRELAQALANGGS